MEWRKLVPPYSVLIVSFSQLSQLMPLGLPLFDPRQKEFSMRSSSSPGEVGSMNMLIQNVGIARATDLFITYLPAFERWLLGQPMIHFQTRSLRKPKSFFLFLLIMDGRPRYLSVPKHSATPSKSMICRLMSWLVFLLKKISDFCMLIACPDSLS